MEHVVALWLCLFLKLPLAAAHAPFKVITVTPAQMREVMAEKHDESDFGWQYQRLQYWKYYPGVNVVDINKIGHLYAVREFGRWLKDTHGVHLILASSMDGLPSPVFSGFVMGPKGDVVANFKLLSGYKTPGTLVDVAEASAERIERYSADRAQFARLAFENLRIAAGHGRDDAVDAIGLVTPELVDKYYLAISQMRRVVGLFEPGRPTWLLAESLSDDGFSRSEAERLKALPGRTLSHVFVMDPGRMISIEKDHFEVGERDCQSDLEYRQPSAD